MPQIGHSLDNGYEALYYRFLGQINKWKCSWGWDNDKSNQMKSHFMGIT